ncbi:MAG: hypothetical protein Q8L02_07725 [Candidatus Nitrotoga sp.]|nr:hypothetical protein [Candidatus Nitrotoga sp.]
MLFTNKPVNVRLAFLAQTSVAHFRLTLQSLITAKTGPTLALIFDSSWFFAASDLIDFTAGLTGAIVDEVVDFSRFSVDQILLVGICCTHIFTISLGAIMLKTLQFY